MCCGLCAKNDRLPWQRVSGFMTFQQRVASLGLRWTRGILNVVTDRRHNYRACIAWTGAKNKQLIALIKSMATPALFEFRSDNWLSVILKLMPHENYYLQCVLRCELVIRCRVRTQLTVTPLQHALFDNHAQNFRRFLVESTWHPMLCFLRFTVRHCTNCCVFLF